MEKAIRHLALSELSAIGVLILYIGSLIMISLGSMLIGGFMLLCMVAVAIYGFYHKVKFLSRAMRMGFLLKSNLKNFVGVE